MTAVLRPNPLDHATIGGWMVVGVLNEAMLELADQPDLPSFWSAACRYSRSIVPARRLCVVLGGATGEPRVVARYAGGHFEGGIDQGYSPSDDAFGRAWKARRPCWLGGPWDEARRADASSEWLLADDPSVVLLVPLRGRKHILGKMLFAIDRVDEADRATMLGSATTYGLCVGIAYTALKALSDLAAANSLQLQQKNAELVCAHVELERAHEALHQQYDIIRTQHETMLSMSTPISEVGDGVLALPIVGPVDQNRAQRMTKALLDAIDRKHAACVILDLTGTLVDDVSTLAGLVRMINAAGLLGCRCVVSGIPAAMARSITMLGVDLGRLKTFRTLKNALDYAVRQNRAHC